MINSKSNYRLLPDVLLQIDKTQTEYRDFWKQEVDFMDDDLQQYVHKSSIFSEKENTLNNTVWNFGEFENQINKAYSEPRRISEVELGSDYHLKYNACKLLFRQGFSWNGLFGVLLVIKGLSTKQIYISQLFKTSDLFVNAGVRELIDNAFWTANISFIIPKISFMESENLSFAIELVKFDDVIPSGPNVGTITSYPSENNFEPLITEEALPSFISVDVELLDNQYLKVKPVTLQPGKTLQQSLLEYFGLSDQVIEIQINHIIRYGNETNGYKSIGISNEDNQFGEIITGLYLPEFIDNEILIFVSTQFVVANKLMKREQQIYFDFTDLLNPILQQVLPTDGLYPVYPVTVKNETVINQQVIQTDIEQKIVTISQPVFVTIESHEISYDNKNISFTELNEHSYIAIGEDTINSKLTIDNKYYFDLSVIQKPEKKIPFNVYSLTNRNLIVTGFIS